MVKIGHALSQIKNLLITLYIRFKGNKYFLKPAVRKAERLHRETGKRYRVFFFGYRYHAWDNTEIRKRMNNGLFKKELRIGKSFNTVCYYDSNPESQTTNHKSKILCSLPSPN